jgi:hypothetical protein
MFSIFYELFFNRKSDQQMTFFCLVVFLGYGTNYDVAVNKIKKEQGGNVAKKDGLKKTKYMSFLIWE